MDRTSGGVRRGGFDDERRGCAEDDEYKADLAENDVEVQRAETDDQSTVDEGSFDQVDVYEDESGRGQGEGTQVDDDHGQGARQRFVEEVRADNDRGGHVDTTTTTTTEWTPTNAVSEKLMSKPNQLARLKAVLPAGTDLNDATAGFKNFGQLNAAVNASRNLGIDFADLKAAMTGTTLAGEPTNQPTLSLGQAIQQYKPGVDGDVEAATATAQAARDGGQ